MILIRNDCTFKAGKVKNKEKSAHKINVGGVVPICSTNRWEAEARESESGVQSQPQLHSKFEA